MSHLSLCTAVCDCLYAHIFMSASLYIPGFSFAIPVPGPNKQASALLHVYHAQASCSISVALIPSAISLVYNG